MNRSIVLESKVMERIAQHAQVKTRRMSSQFLMGGWLISILSATTLLGSAPLDLDEPTAYQEL